jgi:hypothetical protein
MIFPEPIFFDYMVDIDDYINVYEYKTVDQILEFFSKLETPATMALSSLGFLMKAKKDKSLNFAITRETNDYFSVYLLDEAPSEDHEIIYEHGKYGGDLICYRYNTKERVLRDVVQCDEYFEEEKNNIKGYMVYRGTGLTTHQSEFTLTIKRNFENSKKSVKKYSL